MKRRTTITISKDAVRELGVIDLVITPKEVEFLRESNAIEGVYDEDSLLQACYAWAYLRQKKYLTKGIICKVHKILMLHQPIRPDEKGYYRHRTVYIGGEERKSNAIERLMEVWVHQINSALHIKMNKSYLGIVSKKLHIHYESIHPFIDGNGRTGRMFMNFFRIKVGLPVLVIKEAEKKKYYAWFWQKEQLSSHD